jgi:hypothetical protein
MLHMTQCNATATLNTIIIIIIIITLCAHVLCCHDQMRPMWGIPLHLLPPCRLTLFPHTFHTL